MRRFEFSEGSSNKFWQVAIADHELHITWGKIGTAGQTQTKSFASAVAAQQELSKLVLEKTKKGYAEVAADGAAGPDEKTEAAPAADKPAVRAAAKKPAAAISSDAAAESAASKKVEAPAAGATKKAEGAVSLPALPEHIVPDEPRFTREPPELPDQATCLAKLAEHYKTKSWATHTYASELQSGLAHAQGAYREFAERILQSYAVGKAPPTLDADGDGAFLHSGPKQYAIAYLLARGGFAYVIEAMIRSAYVCPTSTGGQGGSWTNFEARQPRLQDGIWLQDSAEFVRNLLPLLSAESRAAGRAVAEKGRGEPLPVRIALAHAFADKEWMAQDTAEILALKKNEYSYAVPRMLFGQLRDLTLLGRLADRHPGDVPMEELIDELGMRAVPALIACFANDSRNEYRARTLARVECLPVAKALVDALSNKRAAEVAKEFYARRPDLAIVALSPVVARGDKIAPYVKPVLDAIVREHPDVLAKVIAYLDAKSRALFEAASGAAVEAADVAATAELPAIFTTPLPAAKKAALAALPAFVNVSALPQVLLKGTGKALPDAALAIVLTILQRSTLTEPHPGVAAVRAECTPESLSALAWALFEQWVASAVGSKENWAFTALGLLGDNEAARRLTPLIRTWPGESQHARAALGLEILAGIGTDLALMHLHGVAEKVKFKALQDKAREKIAAIAAARGLTSEELADRLVPDLGLDENGSLTLDFGSRTFTVGFDETLAPLVRDAAGKTLGELPKPGKSDDAAQAATAVERWKTLKKDARAVASSQLTRLELAMCAQRRWKLEDFSAFILHHPLVVHLARRLVWGVFQGPKLTQTFRIAEDGTFAGPDDDTVTLAGDAVIGLVHRLEFPEPLLGKWGGVFADYKILQPFDQLGRQVFFPTEAEKKASSLHRHGKFAAKTGKVMGLEIRGWRKGEPQDAGWVYDMIKPLPGGIEANFGLGGGLCMGGPDMNPPTQEIEALWLTRGPRGKATFGELSPTVFSELLREFEGLRE